MKVNKLNYYLKMLKIRQLYKTLLKKYDNQGWWPLLDCDGSNPTKTGVIKGYHPGDYTYPKNNKQRFEICIGAILTQNTSWNNVEKALINLKKNNLLSPDQLLKSQNQKLITAIRPAGYFNQKAKKLIIFSEFFTKNKTPSREQLLNLWGIGPETADSILLYAYNQPEFVVDAYTRRIVESLKIIKEKASYDEIKGLFESSLEKDWKLFQEYHALLVEHAKRYYQKMPYGQGDDLL